MKERIDIAELLKNCPQGMELDCTMMDNVVFEKIDISNYQFPIVIRNSYDIKMHLTRYGQYFEEEDYKCIIFPKGKTSWEGFTPPHQFKDGDIISDKFSDICIFKGEGNIKGTVDFYCGITDKAKLFLHIKDNKIPDLHFGNINRYNLASEEEKQKLFEAIKRNGYEWNFETKSLEQLVVPKFKVGDTVRHEEDKTVITIIAIKDDYYVMQSYDQYRSGGYQYTKTPIKDQDQYKLFNFHDKLDISTLEKIEPKFKVGDKVRLKNDKNTIETINDIFSDSYRLYSDSYGLGSHHLLFFKEQDEWELVPDKFEISTLKSFESKVLVRTTTRGYWKPAFWGAYTPDNSDGLKHHEYLTTVGFTRYCIPYEGNEKLLGTTNDCDDYFKTWEE